MGGHGPNIEANPNNMKEEDATLSEKIRPIEFIKHNPQLFHMAFWNPHNMYEIAGGFKTCFTSVVGGTIALNYFLGMRAGKPYNFYINAHMGMFRFAFGALLGLGAGFMKWGDRQKLHNAFVAERLRRRYPESMTLSTSDLWQYKSVKASHPYYNWT